VDYNDMDDATAERIWNADRCIRCPALEARLKTAIQANASLKRGMEELFKKTEELVLENKKLTAALASSAVLTKWGQA